MTQKFSWLFTLMLLGCLLIAALPVVAQENDDPIETPALTPTGMPEPATTATVTADATDSATPTVTTTVTLEPTGTVTPTQTATATVAPTDGPEPTATATPLPTGTTNPTTTSTATPEPTATIAPTATPGPTATPDCWDPLEPNDQARQAVILLLNQPVTGLTLSPLADVDYFQIWVKPGRYYQLTTATTAGVDTRLRVFKLNGQLLHENDDYSLSGGDPASRLEFQATEEGWLLLAVDSVVPIAWGCRQYSLLWLDLPAPTPTPTGTPEPTGTPVPTPTPEPALYDAYEPNYDFETAANIAVGQVVELNFYSFPPGHPGEDNDFFRFYVKVGQELQLETLELAPGIDTNLILYRADGSIIGGNDDCGPGERRSCLTWSPDYTGLAYALIGPVGLLPQGVEPTSLSYRFSLIDLTGQPAEVASVPGYGEPAPLEPSDLDWPVTPPAEAETFDQIRVQTYSLAPPAPTAPPLKPLVIQLTVYYDENDNNAPDINEGVAGINVRVVDSVTNRLLGQAFTDAQGHTTLFVSATNEVRLTVGYLGYSQAVKPPGGQFQIRLPGLQLPSLIP
jgi:hypothetical protein